MYKTQVTYYISEDGFNPVRSFINSLLELQRAKIFRIFHLIKEYGVYSVPRHVKKLQSTHLWEIKIVGKDNMRIIFNIPYKSTIMLLNGFIKKTKKTPMREITTAVNRLNDWTRRNPLDK